MTKLAAVKDDMREKNERPVNLEIAGEEQRQMGPSRHRPDFFSSSLITEKNSLILRILCFLSRFLQLITQRVLRASKLFFVLSDKGSTLLLVFSCSLTFVLLRGLPLNKILNLK